jgi:hypothetical protein
MRRHLGVKFLTAKTIRQIARRPRIRLMLAVTAAFALAGGGPGGPALQAQRGPNPVSVENGQSGDTGWDISGAGDPTIQGFATDISVNTGQTVNFKIQTDSTNYKLEIYRLGYYGGAGARKITTLGPFTQPQNQTVTCATDTTTGLVDCGNWAVFPTSWTSTGAVSGIYVAKLTRNDTGGASHIVFIVRDDARQADVVVQTSDTTWQAYNRYGIGSLGGGSLYCGGPISNAGSAYATSCPTRSAKVSYNRPIDTRGHDPQSFLFASEYPMVRWLEANGYDVKYWAGVDTDRRGADLTGARKPKAFVSMGHDEYWSTAMRDHVEQAAASGVNLAFLGANAMYRHIRFESSSLGATRREVNYRVAHADPMTRSYPAEATVQWRDHPVNRPEDRVLGAMYECNPVHADAVVYDPVPWLFAGTGLGAGDRVTGLIGREYDRVFRDTKRPRRLWVLFRSPVTCAGARSVADTTLARFPSGAAVFDAATQGFVCAFSGCPKVPVDERVQRLVHNLLDAYMSGVPSGPEPRPFSVGPMQISPPRLTQQHPEQAGPSSGVRTIPSTPRRR